MNHNFDIAAPNYDDTFTHSNIGKLQRYFVYKYASDALTSANPLRILEINCGTGEDAKYMEGLGHEVIATDISNEMINVAKSKCNPSTITFQQLDINQLSEKTFERPFDLIFSNFGGLNCLSPEELNRFLKKVSNLLSKNGKLAFVLMPKNTLWERFYFMMKGDLAKAKRRNTNTFLLANVDGVSVKTWYYNPKDILKKAIQFQQKKLKPIGLWIPPSYLEHSFVGNKNILQILKYLELLFSGAFFSKYADHYYIELEKKTDF